MRSVTLPAYAKVNLYLDVLGVRPDGYHELLTLFERIDLADELTVEEVPGKGLDIRCDHPEVPSDPSNLVARAVEIFRKKTGWDSGVRVSLKKSIPVAAGLGGGSSDGAATLLALKELSRIDLRFQELLPMARELGADCPFFLAQVPWAIGTGRGDEITPAALSSRLWHLLVYPGFPISTQAVYQALRQGLRAAPRTSGSGDSLTPQDRSVTFLENALRDNQLDSVRNHLFNALEPTVEALFPSLKAVKAAFRDQRGDCRPLVSGSGSTVFGVFGSSEEAHPVAQGIREKEPGWEVFVACTMG